MKFLFCPLEGEERIGNPGVKLEFHVWFSDMAVIKWGEGRNFY